MNEQQLIPDGIRRELDRRIETARGNVASVRQEIEKQLKQLGAEQAVQVVQSPEAQSTNGEIALLRGELLYLDSLASAQNRSTTNGQPSHYRSGEQGPVTLGEKWRAFEPGKMLLFWGMLAAVVLTLILGFTWGGWMTAGGATKLADTTARDAVVARLAPMCVAQFNLDPAKDQKFQEFNALDSYKRAEYVRTQGWATMPGEQDPDRRVVDACVKLLMQSAP